MPSTKLSEDGVRCETHFQLEQATIPVRLQEFHVAVAKAGGSILPRGKAAEIVNDLAEFPLRQVDRTIISLAMASRPSLAVEARTVTWLLAEGNRGSPKSDRISQADGITVSVDACRGCGITLPPAQNTPPTRSHHDDGGGERKHIDNHDRGRVPVNRIPGAVEKAMGVLEGVRHLGAGAVGADFQRGPARTQRGATIPA